MSAFQFAATEAPRRREQPEEKPRRRQGGGPQQEEAALPDDAVQYVVQDIIQEGAMPALAEEVLAEAPAPAVGGWTAGGEAMEKVKEEAEALKRAAALQLSA